MLTYETLPRDPPCCVVQRHLRQHGHVEFAQARGVGQDIDGDYLPVDDDKTHHRERATIRGRSNDPRRTIHESRSDEWCRLCEHERPPCDGSGTLEDDGCAWVSSPTVRAQQYVGVEDGDEGVEIAIA